ncbi:MAG TPA: hypothetical protein VH593_16455 [Ktedonobacteraceae bacterium]
MESRDFPRPSKQRTGVRKQECNERQVETFSVQELTARCAQETSKFLQQHVFDERFCMELFRRAIVHHDDESWIAIYQQYASLVLTWVTQHQNAALLLSQEGGASLVNAAFAKFSQALNPEKMKKFDSLAALLKYLKLCVHSVVSDELRARQMYQREETLEAIEHEPASADLADDIVASLSVRDLWRLIQEELNGDDERMLMYLAYVQGMKPGEICLHHRQLFSSVDDVYRIKRNILERLRRSKRLQALFMRTRRSPEESR